MEIAKLILDYIKVLIWPGVAMFVLLRFRANISDLISRTRTLSTPAGSLEFAEEVRALRDAVESREENLDHAEAAEGREVPQARDDRTAFDIYRDIAITTPEAAVMAAWLHVEKKLKEAVDVLYADAGGSQSLKASTIDQFRQPRSTQLAHALEARGWDSEWVDLTNKLRRVRNQASHQVLISSSTAREYVESCEFLVWAIDELVDNN
ncbi:hypothetical protein ACG5V6_12375 [Streptomyces chitinivorans]|uniref:DUF4145 domain-containing protein n=1 Tax=Streptomyces chitinivorans TaxID=1257027 RepID=A0ABW7HSZ1_9ACTN|nr:hypothetical protein [Streptomyces chitinivorans]MDH2408922.1 hypothetical protein [Streptomyces chitinivorans]